MSTIKPMNNEFNSMIDDFLNQDEDYEEQVRYGSEMLATDLFNAMLHYYPEALPEVLELLDKLHNQYRGRINAR